MVNEISIDTLIKQLSDKDGLVREKARLTLVDIGKEATLALTKLLTDKDQQTRWEAAKALVAIADPVAIPALIKTLEAIFSIFAGWRVRHWWPLVRIVSSLYLKH